MAVLVLVLLGALFQFAEGLALAPNATRGLGASHEFLRDIVRFFGHNESITAGNLEEFLNIVAARRHGAVSEPGNPLHGRKCLSAEQILSHWGLANVSHLSVGHLESVCPAVLTQVLVPSCPYTGPPEPPPPTLHYSVWAWGFLSVTLINLAALLGLLLIPFTRKPYFPKVLTYFIGLAIGTLFSNAVLQLVPEALGLDPKADNYVHNAVGVFGGFYLLFLVERILTMALRVQHQHNPPSHFATVDDSLANGEKKDSRLVLTSVSSISTAERSSVSSQRTEDINLDQQDGRACCLAGRRLASIKTVAWMITLSDAVHNFIDGLAIGASFTVSPLAGFSTSIAIVCEEFPHELGDFVILLNSGMSVPQAVFFNLLSAMSCYVGLVLGVLLGSNFAPNPIFAVAGGMFLYIALADMFPEMDAISRQQEGTRAKALFFLIQNAGLLSGFAVILLITVFAGDINLG
ncbi:metal cation symporter ZIP8 isoform X1 [Corythoichthys intestinalis]|uniref:metal cation symporter ZIP8 isoform X1 n=1 Tax=Corythoichthys intestinalis TaxID=161448 RepID=UPI0025A505EB|nr:metal cation symporter ZIP8 isoform X1 [Corythoichthys intestinalis]